MRLLRVGAPGWESPALLDEAGRVRDLSGVIDDLDPSFLAADGIRRLSEIPTDELPILATEGLRVGPPLRPGKIVCTGLNYRDHAAETGAPLPTESSS